MQSYTKVDFCSGYTPASEEQRTAVLAAQNARNRKRYELKRAALDLCRLEGRRAPCTVALVFGECVHG